MAAHEYICTTILGNKVPLIGVTEKTSVQYLLAMADRLGAVRIDYAGGCFKHNSKTGWQWQSHTTGRVK
jgi:hypothetical protein